MKGKIKRVWFEEDMVFDNGAVKGKRSKLIYFLSDDPSSEYCGDQVFEKLIFKTYEDCVEYYKNNPAFAS